MTGAAKYPQIGCIVGTAFHARYNMMDFKKPGVVATGRLALVTGLGQYFPPSYRRD